jgi:hypothetical protein
VELRDITLGQCGRLTVFTPVSDADRTRDGISIAERRQSLGDIDQLGDAAEWVIKGIEQPQRVLDIE